MIVSHKNEVEGKTVVRDDLKNVVKKTLVGPEQGWEGWVMRLFELGPGGYTPLHKHPWPHINYVVKGPGIIHLDGKDHRVEEGAFAFLPAGKVHQFRNPGQGDIAIICIVPEEGDK